MEFMIDTANIAEITKMMESLPLCGVTSNPSILKKEGDVAFFDHLKQIRALIGKERSLHVQVVAMDAEGMIKDAHRILAEIDDQVYVKIPVNMEGLKAMKALKAEGVNITATAIYTEIQGYYAIEAGADYIAPYFNRMENMNIDPCQVISGFAQMIAAGDYPTKILGASFKNIGQVNKALLCGAQAVTVGTDVLAASLGMPAIQKAVDDFNDDWVAIHGFDKEIYKL